MFSLVSPPRLRRFVSCLGLWASLGAFPRALAEPVSPVDDGAAALHRSALVVDLHVDTPYQLVKRGGYSLRERLPFLQMDVPRMRAGNLGAQFFALWPPPQAVKAGRADRFCGKALRAIRRAAKESGALEMVSTADELLAARGRGKIAGLLGLEGAECLMGRVENLAKWREEGVRYLGLTWNFANPFATPAQGAVTGPRGLTKLGHALVAEAERLGVLVDVSHSDERTFWDVYRASKGPVIASHSSAFALRAHKRNVDDEQARAIARTGGVIGVNFYRPFLGGRRVTVDDVARHAVHLVRVAGERHVALGSDFDGNITVPDGLEDPSKLPSLTAALRAAGLSAAQVRLVLGENAVRVLRDAGKELHDGPKRVPLSLTEVAPVAGRRLFDRNERTRHVFRGGRPVSFRFEGRPTHLGVTRCGRAGTARLELRREGVVVHTETLRLEPRRTQKALPELPAGAYTGRVWGTCLLDFTIYGA